MKVLAGTAIALVVVAGSFIAMVPDPVATFYRLRGESLTVEPECFDLGKGAKGQCRAFQISVTNHTGHPIRLVGGTDSCPCVVIDELPLTIAPGASVELPLRARFAGTPGEFRQQYVIYTDDDYQPEVVARFRGRVVEAP